MQRRHHRRKCVLGAASVRDDVRQKRRPRGGPYCDSNILLANFITLAIVFVHIACPSDGLPMKAKLSKGAGGGGSGASGSSSNKDDEFYHLLANRGMFGGDVKAGIGMNDEGTFDFSTDPMRHFTHWPMGIVHYVVDGSAEEAMVLIKAAMLEMMKKTCVKFKKKVPGDGVKNYLRITADDPLGGCWSSVGMDVRKHQTMNLERPTCWDKGVILHELMHTIGFYHEHQRPDRDNYINILYENVQDEIEPHQFSKLPSHKLMDTGVPYDLDSIMHYDTHAFGKQGRDGRQLPTIVQKAPHENEMILPIWARPYLSKLDAKEIDVVYRDACARRDRRLRRNH